MKNQIYREVDSGLKPAWDFWKWPVIMMSIFILSIVAGILLGIYG